MRAAVCPICGKPQDQQTRPFCSKRCADIDLGRWLGGEYSIPLGSDDEDDGAARPNVSEGDAPGRPH